METHIFSKNRWLSFLRVMIILVLTTTSLHAQFGGGGGGGSISIFGPTTANAGETRGYGISGPSNLTSTTWTVSSNAQLISGTTYNASVRFNSSGNAYVDAFSIDSFFGFYSAVLNVTVSTAVPPTPGSPSISSNNCGAPVLTRNGSPPSGVTWYWQGRTSNGTSLTKGSGSTYTANEGSGYYYIRARNSSGQWSNGSGTVYVNVTSFNAGSINGAQTICYQGDPGTLGNSSSPSGGSGGYNYQWQYSLNGSSGWQNISGATSSSYNPPGGLTASRWYRRRVISCGTQTKYTGTVKVTVRPNLNAGSINGTQTVCYQGDPGTLGNSSSPSGGNGSYSYQWQSSPNGSSNWQNISGATGSTYNPPSGLTASTWYRRRVSSCSQTKYSGNIKVTVQPNLNAGSINGTQTVCYQGDPSTLGSSANASGGNGSYSYQWQYSTNGSSNWQNISGATASTYNPPGGLTASRWYRRRVISCSQTKYTSNILVTVTAQIAVPATPSITNNCGSTVLTRSNPPSGITWYWQSSATGTSLSNSNTSITRTSGSVYYLRGRNSNGCWGTARTINYSITPAPTWYADTDGDGFGNASVSTSNCSQPSGYVSNDDDYNDTTVNITNIAPQNFYDDTDGDGFGDPNISVYYSVQPSGYVTNSIDQCPQTAGTNNGCDYTVPTLSDENYVYTRSPQVAMSTINDSQILDNAEIIDQVAYFDGLGRPIQNIAIKASPSKKDMVTHTAYDEYGRQVKEYMSYENATTVGIYKTGDQALATNLFYKNHYPNDFAGLTATNSNAYAESLFESSPLNRPLKQAAPGEAWKMGGGHEIELVYDANIANEVRYYRVEFSGGNPESPTLIENGFYPVNQLYKNVTYDENHTTGKDHSVEEFTDKTGRIILKRTYENEVAHDTYYIYDDFGNLSYVLPPKVDTSNGVSTTELSELCYQYKYDYRNRLIEKKIPGKGWEYFVYNKLDQAILTQDINLKTQGKWLFTKYDAFGRVVYTGMVTSGSRQQVQTAADAVAVQYESKSSLNDFGGNNIGIVYYSNNAYPTTNITQILTVNYYDNYTFNLDGLSVPSVNSYGQAIKANVKGLTTGSKERVLGTNSWITKLTFYDIKSRPIYLVTKNAAINSIDIIENKLGFVDRILETKSTHTKGSNNPIVVIERFSYDHAARLIRQTHQIGSGTEEVIAKNTYDEIGQLVQKGVGNQVTGNRLQTIDYSYNVRGWLKTINDVNNLGNDLFSFKINYHDPTTGTALYNGNISQTQWRTANTDNSLRTYTYSYDALNRIKSATDNTSNYNLVNVNYDKNGNILALNRKGHTNAAATTFGTMDNLVYTYDSGNKLTKVLDNGNDTYGFKDGANQTTEYTYDQNGNMITDVNKGITGITYNHLNLPTEVVFDNNQNKKISYIYNASGVKIKKQITDGSSVTITEYAGNYIYENSNLQFFITEEGYVESNGSTYEYIYQCKDHLGNIRLSYSDSNNDGIVTQSEIIEENNYYPFGLKHKGYNSNQGAFRDHKFEYQGQELTENFGFDLIEYSFRMYNPEIGRFIQIDPLAEDFEYNGSYNFAENRVIEAIELEGLEAFFVHGTWNDPDFMSSTQKNRITKVFENQKKYDLPWSGDNTDRARREAANKLVELIADKRDKNESSITLVGHSHGGNVAILAANMLRERLGEDVKINVLTINTPVRNDYQLDDEQTFDHFNVFTDDDAIQTLGVYDSDRLTVGSAGRKFDSAINIQYEDQISPTDDPCGISNHCGTAFQNVNKWLPEVSKAINKIKEVRQKFRRAKFAEEAKMSYEELKKSVKTRLYGSN